MDFEKDNSSEEEAEEPIINKEKNISDEQMDVTSVTDENMDENEQEPKEQDPEEAFEQLANGFISPL
jgi:hypothetical protein